MFKNLIYSFSTLAIACSLTAFSTPAAAADTADFLFSESAVVDTENLAEMRGTALGSDLMGIAVFDALSTNNISNGTVSGGNTIAAGAFSESSGMSTIIQNSGNNVLIQSATILNLNIN